MYPCPRCDEAALVVKTGQEATCGVCGTTFDAPDNLPVPCSCDEFGICNECIGPKLNKYEDCQEELVVPEEFLKAYFKDKNMEEVQIWMHKF